MRAVFRKKYKTADSLTAYGMLFPAFAILTIFGVLPLIMAIGESFQDYTTKAFTFANFDYILKTPEFLKSFGNAILFTVIITALMMLLSFLFAHVVKGMQSSCGSIVKIIIYIPCLISSVATSIIFTFLLNYGGGLITSILIAAKLEPISFLTQGIWPQAVVIAVTLWCGFGYNTLVMLAGLLNIPKDYYEAAAIDGAGAFTCMIRITIPGMTNYFILMLINLITGNMQMLDIPYMITGGGPLNRTLTPALYLYNSFRDSSRTQNVTIAGALVIMVVILVINAGAFGLMRSKKSED